MKKITIEVIDKEDGNSDYDLKSTGLSVLEVIAILEIMKLSAAKNHSETKDE